MKWRLFICTDCDSDDGVVVMQVPDDASPERGCAVQHCPGCGSYLSMMSWGEVEVTGSMLAGLKLREPVE